MTHTTSPHKHKQGFSLVELLVVMAVIAILMGIVIGVSGSIQRKAAEAKARAEIADLMNELEVYKSDMGTYPSSLGDLVNWYQTEKYKVDFDLTDLNGTTPVDPWGNPYEYPASGVKEFTYFIGSKGPDKNLAADDITNRNGAL
ncbi:MAG: type II secretion system protein GspG [Kiritimatiellia bacterium]